MVKCGAGLKLSSRLSLLRKALLLLLTCGLAVIGPTPPGTAAAGSVSGSSAIVDLPVAFGVENTNSSGVPCPSDGAHYTVRGNLVGPRWALEGRRPRAVTVYLHGINVGGFMWRLPGFEELDHAASLARRGHVSLVIDQMGYDSSGHSHGWLNCLGSQADMTRQLVERLRTGGYAVAGGAPVSFQTVVLAGHDTGATIADIVAYSYPGAIDALVHFNWAEQGFTLTPQVGFAEAAPVCASGGQPAEQGPPDRDDPAGGPSGYVQFLTDSQIRAEQFNTEPAVVDRLMRMVNRNPCGQFSQIPAVLQINTQRLPEIEIPVLYGYTDHEFIWTQEGLAQQAQHYRNSRDLTTVVIRNAGHFPNFSRVASNFHSTIAQWLSTRGFVSTPKGGSG
jgi:pimeloyl-ACP methyl ester carboxylesterase